MADISSKQAEFEGYEIRVQGHLEKRRIRTFEGLVVAYQANGETVISGPIQDQAALYGLLNRLRDLGIPLLSVNPLTKKGWRNDRG